MLFLITSNYIISVLFYFVSQCAHMHEPVGYYVAISICCVHACSAQIGAVRITRVLEMIVRLDKNSKQNK